MTRFAILTTVLVSVPALLSAQDIPTGPYVGFTLGATEYDNDDDIDFDGAEYGLVAGVSGTRGRLYGAAEIEYSFSDVEADEEISGVDVSVEEESKFAISGMVGGVVTPNFVLYGKVSALSIEYDIEASGFGTSVDFSDSSNGTAYGIGGQYFFSPDFSVRGEVMAFDVDIDFDDLDVEGEAEGTTAKLGVMYHF